jgi:hypothetical protein
MQRVIGLMRDVLAPFLLVPILAIAAALGARQRWRAVLPFLVMPLIYALYFGNRDRFHIDLLPFAAIGIAMSIWRTRERSWRAAAVVVLLALLNLAFASEWATGDLKRPSAEESRITSEVDRRSHDRRLLVLIGARESRVPFVLHGADTSAPVLVFQSQGAADSVLLRRFSDREAIRVRWDSAHTHAVLAPIEARP